jgi:hypothetical protein
MAMNRHQRRLKEYRREDRKIQKVAEIEDNLRREGVHQTVDAIDTLMMYVLCVKFGFRGQRLGRYLTEFNELVGKLSMRRVSEAALLEDLREFAGVEKNETSKGSEWYFPRRKDERK